MTVQDAISQVAQNEEERILGRRVADLYEIFERTARPMTTGFLSLSEQAFCNQMAKKAQIPLFLWGGYEKAERKIAVFSDEQTKNQKEMEIKALSFHFSEELSHRDILGAAMGLSIKRENIGDILVANHAATVLVLQKMAPFLQMNLTMAGHCPLQGEEIELDAIQPIEPTFIEQKDTVASLRVDCILASAFQLSRDAAKKAVMRELVQVNYRTVLSPNYEVKEGDIISMRQKGKFILEEIGGESKKGRTWIAVKKYV